MTSICISRSRPSRTQTTRSRNSVKAAVYSSSPNSGARMVCVPGPALAWTPPLSYRAISERGEGPSRSRMSRSSSWPLGCGTGPDGTHASAREWVLAESSVEGVVVADRDLDRIRSMRISIGCDPWMRGKIDGGRTRRARPRCCGRGIAGLCRAAAEAGSAACDG